MRRLHPYRFLFAGIPALLLLALLLAPATARASRSHAPRSGRKSATRHRPLAHRSSRHEGISAAQNAHARLLRVHTVKRMREHHTKPHTARALRHARKHGTEAVQAAARHETERVARGESTGDASASLHLPELPLATMNLPPLRGTHESLVRQNERAEQDGLLRVKDDADLNMLRRDGSLVPLPEVSSMHADARLPMNRRYCRAWTGRFLNDLARVHFERFHKPLQVNSAVRTIEYQRRLLQINGNAAPAEGDVASPHLTGAAVDIAKKGLTPSEVAWMRAYLLPLQVAGKIDVEEEFKQSCFHISVYKSYAAPQRDLASTAKAPALLASGVR